MVSDGVAYVNGDFCPLRDAKVSVLDRGLLMGDALYEVVRIQNGAPFRAGMHHERMSRGAGALRMPIPFSPAEFDTLCRDLAKRNGVTQGSVYIQVSRGNAQRTHLVPEGLSPTVIAFGLAADLPSWRGDFPAGVPVITTRDERWARCDLKTTMLLANSLAKQKARDSGAFEAVLVSDSGTAREGASSNLFAVIDGVLRTHPADERILPGITRATVIDLAKESDIRVVEDPFDVQALPRADEAFLTGTTTDVCPIVSVDGRTIGTGRPGQITERLASLYEGLLAREAGRGT